MNTNAQPTRVRWYVVGVTTLMSVLLYLDRFCISTAEIYIKEDLRLSSTQIGWFVSAFFWSYALAQVGTGWLADRYGPRTMLTLYILSWSAFTALLGLSTGFLSLFLLRLGIGVAQAGAYPAGAGVVRYWMPVYQRGLGSSFVAFGGRAGASLALLVTGFVIVFFAPSTKPSTLSSTDFLHVQRFCFDLFAPKSDPKNEFSHQCSRILWSRLSPETLEFVTREACRYSPKSGDEGGSVSELESLAGDINRALADAELFSDPLKLPNIPLEGEAKRLLRRDRVSLASHEVVRLNRLVLEAAHRDSIQKVYVKGWRKTMFLYGALGIIVAFLFWLIHRDTPRLHPNVNQGERDLIGEPKAVSVDRRRVDKLPMEKLLSNFSMWMNCVMQFTTNVGWVLLVTLSPRYFTEVHQVSLEVRSWMAFVPPTVGCVGMLMGGVLTDHLTAKVGPRWGRAFPIILTRVLAGLIYIGCLFQPGPWMAVIAFGLVAFFVDVAIGAVWAYQQDVGGRFVGSVLGWANMWGNLGAAVAPVIIVWLLGETKNWNAVFWFGAIAFFISAVASLGIDATKPIHDVEE